MIGFLQPLALLGLAAVAIPPLLHLMGRRRPPTVSFPAVRYLTATAREHHRHLRLRHLLLMALRTAVIALVVLAAARPVVPVPGGTAHPPSAVAVVVDNSLSAGSVTGGRARLDELRDAARRVVAAIGAEDRLWVTLADGVPRQVTVAQAEGIVDSLSAWPVRLDLGAAVRAAARVVADDPSGRGDVVVISDLQESALSPGPPPPAGVVVWDAPRGPANRGVDTAYAEPTLWSPDGVVIAVVSGQDEPLPVWLRSGGRALARGVAEPGRPVALRPGRLVPGWHVARLELDADDLRADDGWWLALQVVEPAAVRAAAGRFVTEALRVLSEDGRIRDGGEVVLAERLAGTVSVVVPPDDPTLVGGLNRELRARGVRWEFGELLEGEWVLRGDVDQAAGAPVYRRFRLVGAGEVLARADGDPWLVRDRDVLLIASRLEDGWTALPVSAGFVPFLDVLVNRHAARGVPVVRAAPGEVVTLPPGSGELVSRERIAPAGSARRMSAPLTPGVYFLRGAGGDTVGALEVNHDRRESRLARGSEARLRDALGTEVRVAGTRALARELFRGTRRAELTSLLLAAALLAALGELAVASLGAGKRAGT